MIGREQSAAWARHGAWAQYVEMIPEELSAASWTLWALTSGTTLFGDRVYSAVLCKDINDPDGVRAVDYGATEEEATRGAIRKALAIEAASQAQPSPE